MIPLYQSVESDAQTLDAEGKLSAEVGYGEILHIYKLVPIAVPGYTNWDLAQSHGEIKVVAKTADDAREVAAAYELLFTVAPFLPDNDIDTMETSPFRNEQLYTVICLSEDCWGLSRGMLTVDPAKPDFLRSNRRRW